MLDHLYRLFRQLAAEGCGPCFAPLLAQGVSRLLQGEPSWYKLTRQDFLLRIEERKREIVGSA